MSLFAQRRSLRHTRSLFPTHAYAAAEFRRNRGNAAPTYTASSSASGPAMVELFEDEILDVDRDHDSIYQATPRPDPQPDFQAIDTDSDDIDTDAASAVAISRARAQASSRDGVRIHVLDPCTSTGRVGVCGTDAFIEATHTYSSPRSYVYH